MLIGEYQHTIDAKGRMIVPAKFREDLGFTFVVTRGLDGCLYGYPLEQWQLLRQKLSELPQSKKTLVHLLASLILLQVKWNLISKEELILHQL